jgi:hypothetical protein
MELGIPFDQIDEMEWIDYQEYLSVHKIFRNKMRMDMFDAALYAKAQNRKQLYETLVNENLLLSGINPFLPKKSAIEETRRKLKEMAEQQKHQRN